MSVLWWALTVGCGSGEKGPADGTINGASVRCTEAACELWIDATLVDLEGEPVQSNLSASQFTLEGVELSDGEGTYEVAEAAVVGVEAEVTAGGSVAAPLVIDQSGSMDSTDPGDLRLSAAQDMVEAFLGQGDAARMALLSFPRNQDLGDLAESDLVQDFTQDEALLDAAIDGLAGEAGGGTPLYGSILEVLDFQAARREADERGALFVLTDGSDSGSGAGVEEVIEHALALDTPVYVAGLGADVDFDELAELTSATGGIFVPADDPELLTDGLEALTRSVYGSVTIEAELTMSDTSDPLTEGRYHILGTVRWQDELSMPLDVDVYLPAPEEAE